MYMIEVLILKNSLKSAHQGPQSGVTLISSNPCTRNRHGGVVCLYSAFYVRALEGYLAH